MQGTERGQGVPESDRASCQLRDPKCPISTCLGLEGQRQQVKMRDQWLVANIVPMHVTGHEGQKVRFPQVIGISQGIVKLLKSKSNSGK